MKVALQREGEAAPDGAAEVLDEFAAAVLGILDQVGADVGEGHAADDHIAADVVVVRVVFAKEGGLEEWFGGRVERLLDFAVLGVDEEVAHGGDSADHGALDDFRSSRDA